MERAMRQWSTGGACLAHTSDPGLANTRGILGPKAMEAKAAKHITGAVLSAGQLQFKQLMFARDRQLGQCALRSVDIRTDSRP
jgi:hypothetical protein